MVQVPSATSALLILILSRVRERCSRGLHRRGGSPKLLGIGMVRLARAIAKNLSRAKVAKARLTNLILMCGL
jgi:hypothetical protein